MQGARWFLKTDLNKGYWQLALSEKSKELCTLSTHLGCVRPNRVPMGVKISGELFDAKIASILSHCKFTTHNRDDILLGCPTLESLLEEWEKVLAAFEKNGLTLNGKKTIVGLKQIEWYGFLLTENGASPSPKKVQALRSAPRPITADGVISFLCTVGFNSRFILRFAEHSIPLRKLSLSKSEFRWTDVHEESFNYLKNALCTNTLNNTFRKHRTTGVFCDAGKKQHTKDTPGALSAVLAQRDSDSNWIPIQFVSRVLSDVETRYSQTELESLSILYGCKRLDFYLRGARGIEIYTDHLPLVTMYNKHLKTTPQPHLHPTITRMLCFPARATIRLL